MDEQRLDELLDIALASGGMPEDATEEERAELAPLLASASVLDVASEAVSAEAEASKTIARARFERFIAAESPPAVPPTAGESGPGWFRRMFQTARPVAAIGSVAAVLVLVAVTVFASDVLLSDTSSAYALEAEPGDYVQIDGVVTEVEEGDDGPRVRVESDGGFIEVDLSGDTSILEDDAVLDAGSIRVGQLLAVAGQVNDHRRVQAAVLTVRGEGGDDHPAPRKPEDAGPIDAPLIGEIIFVRFDRDQRQAERSPSSCRAGALCPSR